MSILPFLAALTLTSVAGADDLAPPTGPHRLAFTFTSQTEVAFLDLASLARTGDVVEGWSLNVFAEPFKPDYAPVAASTHWSRVRIDCAGQTARFTHGLGVEADTVLFSVPIEMAETPVRDGWALDEAYACRGEEPARPTVDTLTDARDAAAEIMASDAWAAEGE